MYSTLCHTTACDMPGQRIMRDARDAPICICATAAAHGQVSDIEKRRRDEDDRESRRVQQAADKEAADRSKQAALHKQELAFEHQMLVGLQTACTRQESVDCCKPLHGLFYHLHLMCRVMHIQDELQARHAWHACSVLDPAWLWEHERMQLAHLPAPQTGCRPFLWPCMLGVASQWRATLITRSLRDDARR